MNVLAGLRIQELYDTCIKIKETMLRVPPEVMLGYAHVLESIGQRTVSLER